MSSGIGTIEEAQKHMRTVILAAWLSAIVMLSACENVNPVAPTLGAKLANQSQVNGSTVSILDRAEDDNVVWGSQVVD